MNTTDSNVIQDIVSKIPVTLFFEQMPDRKQALKYVTWLFTNNSQSTIVDQDKLFREVISKELRLVSMKIVEIDILFMVALNKITIEDFSLDSKSLIKKIIDENPDKNDLDLMYRILAQIMTKLPMDLRDKVAGKHKLQIFNSISKFINMEPKLLERFVSFNPALNTPITMDMDAGDYNTLNKKYLDELAIFEKSQPYVDSNSMEYSNIANNMMTEPTLGNNVKGQYIDTSPDLMTGVDDNKLYYFDSSSGTISEFPVNGENHAPISLNDLSNLLSANKVNKGQITSLIQSLQTPSTTSASVLNTTTTLPITTHPISFLNRLGSLLSFGYYNPSEETSSNSIPSNLPAPTVPLINIATPPVPPQFILSQASSSQAGSSQAASSQTGSSNQNNENNEINLYKKSKYIPNPQYNSIQQYNYIRNYKYKYNYNSNYNPTDFINPMRPVPAEFNFKPQNTSNFLTRNDACLLPNPPARCPKITNRPLRTNSNILEDRFKRRDSTYEHFSSFSNMNSNSNSEEEFIKKITKKNKDIENVAIAFVSVIVLLFLLVIFNSIRNKSGLVNTK